MSSRYRHSSMGSIRGFALYAASIFDRSCSRSAAARLPMAAAQRRGPALGAAYPVGHRRARQGGGAPPPQEDAVRGFVGVLSGFGGYLGGFITTGGRPAGPLYLHSHFRTYDTNPTTNLKPPPPPPQRGAPGLHARIPARGDGGAAFWPRRRGRGPHRVARHLQRRGTLCARACFLLPSMP